MISEFGLCGVAAIASGLLALTAPRLAGRRRVGWSLAAAMLLMTVESAAGISIGWAATAGLTADGWRLVGGTASALLPLAWLALALTYARADADRTLRHWRWVLLGAAALPLVAAGFFPGAVMSLAAPEAEMSGSTAAAPAVLLGLRLFILTGSLTALAQLERTYRATTGGLRWRTKFFLVGFGLLFAVRAYTCTQAILVHGGDGIWRDLNSTAAILAVALAAWSFHRRAGANVEVYPSQALIRNSLTVIIAGTYLFAVGVLAKLVAVLGGSAAFRFQALLVLVALVALALTLQSDRARLLARRFVSRHLRRPAHDCRQVWRSAAQAMSACVDERALCRTLVELVAPRFDTLAVSLWLCDARGESLTLAASTVLSELEARKLATPGRSEVAQLIRHFQEHPEPAQRGPGSAAAPGRWWDPAPDQFPGAAYQVWLPLISRGEVLGVLGLGRRVHGAEFTVEDLEILKCLAAHAAAHLRNTQLAQRLLQARELEAFQTMAAFFVHDLKNAAASLSLMLDNLPAHFDDPRFRDDTLRGLGRTVAHVNHLIGRLTQLRHELRIEPGEFDFNQMVSRVVADCGKPARAGIVTDLEPLPQVRFDPEQMSKVVTNLLRNATEAAGPDGHIRVATRRNDGWAVLSVEDDGCGMTPRFVQESLFRPFQTTKPHGLGVGMFQSRMIVEAHQGRMSVESAPGHGTTFQVLLPVEGPQP